MDNDERLDLNKLSDANKKSMDKSVNVSSINENVSFSKISKEADIFSNNKLKFKKPTLLNNLFPEVIDSNTNDIMNMNKEYLKNIHSKYKNENDLNKNKFNSENNFNELENNLCNNIQEINELEEIDYKENLRLKNSASQQEMSETPYKLHRIDNIVS